MLPCRNIVLPLLLNAQTHSLLAAADSWAELATIEAKYAVTPKRSATAAGMQVSISSDDKAFTCRFHVA